MITAETVKSSQARMEKARHGYDTVWPEIARFVYPELERAFNGGTRWTSYLRESVPVEQAHDPYTAMALADGVSLFESFVMPRGQRFQKLELGDEALMRKVANREWLEQKEVLLFGLRNDPQSGFVGATHECATSLYAFGPMSMWVDQRYNHFGRWAGHRYESEFIGDIWIERDAAGNVMRQHRRLALTAEQALRKFGKNAPPAVREAMNGPKADPARELHFLHVIEPNTRFDGERLDMLGKPWLGAYYSETDELVFQQGGYHSLPRIVSAYARSGIGTYGRSPTMTVLPLVRGGQQMMVDRMWGAELRLKPPLLINDDELDGAVLEIMPHGVTHGLNDRGEPLVREFIGSADATDAKELTMEMRQLIDRAFGRDLLQLNREYKSHIPAARIAEEQAEKGVLLAPLAMQEQQWLAPMLERELALMSEAGLLDDMPPEIEEYLAAEGTLGVKYDNGLTHMQEAGKSAAFLNLAQQAAVLAQFDQTYAQRFEREFPAAKVLPELGRIAGVPAAMQATDEEKAAFDEDKAAKANAEQLLAAVPALAGAAKDLSAAATPVGQ